MESDLRTADCPRGPQALTECVTMIKRYKASESDIRVRMSLRARRVSMGYQGFVTVLGDGGWSESCGVVNTNKADAFIDAEWLADDIAAQNGCSVDTEFYAENA